jgi:hypothetical protein
MGKDNGGIRRGPLFRCPDCCSHHINVLAKSRIKRHAVVECRDCDRLWHSKHREANLALAATPRETNHEN